MRQMDNPPPSPQAVAAALRDGFAVLDRLSRDEYGVSLNKLAVSGERDERLVRVARLVGVTIKQPFADPVPSTLGATRTGAKRGWQLRAHVLDDPAVQETWQYQVLDSLRQEMQKEIGGAGDSVKAFAVDAQNERGFWGYLSRSVRKYLCDDPQLKKKIDQALNDAKKAGGGGQKLTPTALLAAAGSMIATALIQALPWLGLAASPVIAGLVVIIGTIGLDAYCEWSAAPNRGKQIAEAEKTGILPPTPKATKTRGSRPHAKTPRGRKGDGSGR